MILHRNRLAMSFAVVLAATAASAGHLFGTIAPGGSEPTLRGSSAASATIGPSEVPVAFAVPFDGDHDDDNRARRPSIVATDPSVIPPHEIVSHTRFAAIPPGLGHPASRQTGGISR